MIFRSDIVTLILFPLGLRLFFIGLIRKRYGERFVSKRHPCLWPGFSFADRIWIHVRF